MTILLVTDSDETDELMRETFASLPAKSHYKGAQPKRKSSTQLAFDEIHAKASEIDLIVLDALVRSLAHEPNVGDGSAASEFLRWLSQNHPSVPVIVVSKPSVERLDLEVLARQNVALWGLQPVKDKSPSDVFEEILVGLQNRHATHHRHITVCVGLDSARYQIRDGYYEFETDEKPYREKDELKVMLRALAIFSPFDKAGDPREDWQVSLTNHGMHLYKLLLLDGLGAALLRMAEQPFGQANITPPMFDLDLRFTVELGDNMPHSGREDLFTLPFEAVNHNGEADSFFCVRFPMARRITKSGGHNHYRAPALPHRPLNILFVDASMGGVVEITHETTGQNMQRRLDRLSNAADEVAILERLKKSPGPRGPLEVRILNATEARGASFREKVRTLILTRRYDILHFCGHAISDDQSSTFLIFPGDQIGEGLAVSVRAVANWVREGECGLVVLSCCRGASTRTAIEMMRAGASATIGFRWDVEDLPVVDYFGDFYRAIFKENKSLSGSFRDACHEQYCRLSGSPLWASAIAVVQD